MLVASLCFGIMGAMIKLAADHASLGEIILARGAVPVVLIGTWALLRGNSLRSPVARIHLRRSSFGIAAMWMGFYSTSHLPLSTATTLMYTSPLFLALIIRFYYQKTSNSVENLCILLGFIGVLLVLQPVFGRDEIWIALIGLAGGAVSAVAYLQLKSLGKVSEPEWRTVLYFGITATVTGLLYNLTWGEFKTLLEPPRMGADSGWIPLLALGFFGGAGNLALTRSFGSGSTWLSASLQYTTILFSTGFGIYLFGDTPKSGTWIGICFIIACGALSTWATRAHQLKK